MNTLQSLEYFHPGSIVHYEVLIALTGICYVIVRTGKAAQVRGPSEVRRYENWLGGALLAMWILINVKDALPGRLCWDRSLPLHICDVVGFAVPFAIFARNRTCQTIVYFWGLGLSSQMFITPNVAEGPATITFYHYWLYHSAIVVAGAYLLFVAGYKPTMRDWRRCSLCVALYFVLVLPVDIRLGVDYGFLGSTSAHQPAIIMALGSWPNRLPKILLSVWSLTLLMQLPWTAYEMMRAEHREESVPHAAVTA